MPNAPEPQTEPVDAFISRWQQAEASERANYQMFLTELCDLLELPHPDPAGADNAFNKYVFDRAITRQKPDGSETTVWADLYKRGAFILETNGGKRCLRFILLRSLASLLYLRKRLSLSPI